MQGLPIRKEVQNFFDASETLLSPAILGSDLTPEECLLIADYVMNLATSQTPWGEYLVTSVRSSARPSS